jgi:hypothetical protein
MSQPANVVSVHPYFKVKPGKLEAFKAALPAFIEEAAKEKGNLYYEFSINGDVAYCCHHAPGSPRSGRGTREAQGSHGRDEADLVHLHRRREVLIPRSSNFPSAMS